MVISVFAGLSACGTTYELPKLGDIETQQANKMFAQAKTEGPRKSLSSSAAEQRFARVSRKIAATGAQYCKTVTANVEDFNCGVDIGIDRKMNERNAYFTHDESGKPIIRITMPMLRDTKSDHEVAFILGHEYGHLIGRHIEKQQKQALAGALIMGTLTAAANAHTASYGGYYDPNAVARNMDLGAAVGSRAYSQTYELESDTLGTRITAAAGYDPIEGAKFFARPEEAKTTSGNLSFWGTHPPDEKRLATVIATVAEIKSNVGLRLSTKKAQ